MSNDELNTEIRIFKAALSIFQLYGYHGTTIQKIASKARVNKSTIHYYFRSKDKLYAKVAVNVIETILNADPNLPANQESLKKQKWFLITELYNNPTLFERILKEFYLDNWELTLNDIKNFLKIGESL